jgi:hypothetical protein
VKTMHDDADDGVPLSEKFGREGSESRREGTQPLGVGIGKVCVGVGTFVECSLQVDIECLLPDEILARRRIWHGFR